MKTEENVLDMLPAGCIIFNDQGKIKYVNSAFCETILIPRSQLLTSDFTKVLSISSQIFYQTNLFPLLKLEGKTNELFLNLKAGDGSRIPVVANAKRELGPDEYHNIFVIITIWERQKYEQELLSTKKALQIEINDKLELQQLAIQLENQKQVLDRKLVEITKRKQEYLQLSKVLTHDLQEPIRKIGIFYDRLLADRFGNSSEKDLEALNRIKSLTAHLRKLTYSIERFVGHDDYQAVTALKVKNISNHAISKINAEWQGVDFEVILEGDVEFQGRKKDMETMFYELLFNSLRFRKPNSHLIIKIRSSVTEENTFKGLNGEYRYADHLRIEISDNGIGFEAEYCFYIFELFNKLDKNSEGSGLGLSLCEQIVSRHHGKITAHSQPGQGARFVILMPIDQENYL